MAPVLSLAWHPNQPGTFITASADSTIRLWHTDSRRQSKAVIVFKSKDRGGKTKVTACAYSPDGRTIAGGASLLSSRYFSPNNTQELTHSVGAGCEDGSIQLWQASSNFARPTATVDGAHTKGAPITSLVFSSDSKRLLSRGAGDASVKLWDVKSIKKPLAVARDLPTLNSEANACFSPGDKYVLVGTAGSLAGVLQGAAEEARSAALDSKMGELVVLDGHSLAVVRRVALSRASVVRVAWHARLNQIVTGSSDGAVHVLYSPESALKGITLAVTKTPRARRLEDGYAAAGELDRPIIAPHTLKAFRDDDAATASKGTMAAKRRHEKERQDAVKTLKPMPPIKGPGKGGRVGAAATQSMVRSLGGVRSSMRDQDPREALIKYATKDGERDEWTAAWKETQPKAIFDTRQEEEEEGQERERRK